MNALGWDVEAPERFVNGQKNEQVEALVREVVAVMENGHLYDAENTALGQVISPFLVHGLACDALKGDYCDCGLEQLCSRFSMNPF